MEPAQRAEETADYKWYLVVLTEHFEVGSGVVADRAFVWNIAALKDIAAVSALPLNWAIFLENLSFLDIF